MNPPTLLVLAAGIGSRYGGLKQIDPVGPHQAKIIDYCIYDAIRAGFGKVVFVIRRDIEEIFRSSIGDRFADRIEVAYAFQEIDDLPAPYRPPADRSKPWGTGHAVLAARDLIQEPFGVVNADDFYGAEGFRRLHDFLAQPPTGAIPEYVLVAFLLRNTLSDHGTVARGICTVSDDGYLETVREHLKIEKRDPGAHDLVTDRSFSGDERVSMNMWGFTADFFQVLEKGFGDFLATSVDVPKSEYLLPEVVDRDIQAGRAKAKVVETPDPWFGVTYAEDKPVVMDAVAALIRDGRYPDNLWGRS